jgi:DNA-directed RNA polymerase subunit RPC12/RpoP
VRGVKKAVVAGLLVLAVGFLLWRMIVGESYRPSEQLVAGIDREHFDWFTCPSCNRLFMAEATTRKGYCPYCNFQLMLVTEDKKLVGTSVNEREFIWFFSPKCGRVFFAYETGEAGVCPYCRESIVLTAPPSTDLEEAPLPAVAWLRDHSRWILAGSVGLFIASLAGIFVALERQIVLTLEPVEGTLWKEARIALSRRQTRGKKLVVGDTADADIVLKNLLPGDVHYELSFVRVGGKTHSYLHHGSNRPIYVNGQPQYNPRLKDHDKVRIGEAVFEVHAPGDK